MVLSIEKIPDPDEQSFRHTDAHLQQAEKHLADPRWHAERHMSALDESDESISDLVELKEMIHDLRDDVDRLNETVSTLSSLINWDNIIITQRGV